MKFYKSVSIFILTAYRWVVPQRIIREAFGIFIPNEVVYEHIQSDIFMEIFIAQFSKLTLLISFLLGSLGTDRTGQAMGQCWALPTSARTRQDRPMLGLTNISQDIRTYRTGQGMVWANVGPYQHQPGEIGKDRMTGLNKD